MDEGEKIYMDTIMGETMRKLRIAARITLDDMARYVDLDVVHLSNLERGLRCWRSPEIVGYWYALTNAKKSAI